MMLNKKKREKTDCSPDSYTDFFDIVARVLRWETLFPNMCIICLDYTLQMSIDRMKNGFRLKKENMNDVDYANDLGLLLNTPAEA